MFTKQGIMQKLDSLLESETKDLLLAFDLPDEINEVAMKRVVRKGKIVRKVRNKKKGFKVLRQGNTARFVRLAQKEKRTRRKAARKAWRTGRGSRKAKAKRTMIRSKVKIRQLYGK